MKITLPAQNIRIDQPTGVDPIWYEKLKALTDSVNALHTALDPFIAAGAYSSSSGFVPVLTSAGGTAPTFTAPALSGLWVKNGNLMFVNISGANTVGGTAGAGAQQLSVSLPSPVRSIAQPAKAIMGTFLNGTTEGLVIGALTAGSTTVPLFRQSISGSNSNLVVLAGADLNNASRALYWRFYYGVN